MQNDPIETDEPIQKRIWHIENQIDEVSRSISFHRKEIHTQFQILSELKRIKEMNEDQLLRQVRIDMWKNRSDIEEELHNSVERFLGFNEESPTQPSTAVPVIQNGHKGSAPYFFIDNEEGFVRQRLRL
jgi:hypothetical protein